MWSLKVKFWNWVILCAFASSLAACTSSPKKSDERFLRQISVVQGFTNKNSAQFNVVAHKSKNLFFAYGPLENQLAPVQNHQVVSRPFSEYVVHKFSVSNLSTQQKYLLQIFEGQELVDTRNFSALDLSKTQPKIAIASCLSDQEPLKEIRDKIWTEALGKKPDVLFLIGDNAYADMWIEGKMFVNQATPEHLWNRYVETRFRVPLYLESQLTPILATWDDHDYGANNSDASYPFKQESKEIFDTFWAQEPREELTKGPGVAIALVAFGQQFIFMDDRSFRTKNNEDIPNQTHWGVDQEVWLLDLLNKKKTPSWILNGDQIWADYHRFESYKVNHPKSFARYIPQLGHAKSPIAFVSGDRHLTEIILPPKDEFPYSTFELTTSGVHAKLFPNPDQPLPKGVLVRNDNQNSYAIISPVARRNKLQVNIKTFGVNNSLLFEKNFSVSK